MCADTALDFLMIKQTKQKGSIVVGTAMCPISMMQCYFSMGQAMSMSVSRENMFRGGGGGGGELYFLGNDCISMVTSATL